MTVQPTKDMKECYQAIDLILMKKLPAMGSMLYIDLLRECLLHYIVSRTAVERFVKDFYLDAGTVTLKDGVLYPSEKKELPRL